MVTPELPAGSIGKSHCSSQSRQDGSRDHVVQLDGAGENPPSSIPLSGSNGRKRAAFCTASDYNLIEVNSDRRGRNHRQAPNTRYQSLGPYPDTEARFAANDHVRYLDLAMDYDATVVLNWLEDAARKTTTPNDATPENSVTEHIVPEDIIRRDASPGDTAAHETAPREDVPNKCILDNTQMGQAMATNTAISGQDLDNEVVEVSYSNTKKQSAPHNAFRESQMARLHCCNAYNNLFLIIYLKKPELFSHRVYLTMKRCRHLAEVATYLCCLPLVVPHISQAFSRHALEDLSIIIKEDAPRWLMFFEKIQSKQYFTEAMVHIAGNYQAWPWMFPFAQLPGHLRGLIIHKVGQLQDMVAAVNQKLLMTSIVNEDGIPVSISSLDVSSRETWIVVQLWHDWFSSQYQKTDSKPHNRGQLYRIIQKGGNAYLPLQDVQNIVQSLSLKADAADEWAELHIDLALMKEVASKHVGKLCINRSVLDVEAAGIKYLTCTNLRHEELPWEGRRLDESMDVEED